MNDILKLKDILIILKICFTIFNNTHNSSLLLYITLCHLYSGHLEFIFDLDLINIIVLFEILPRLLCNDDYRDYRDDQPHYDDREDQGIALERARVCSET